ncbi:hydantoinase/oxoprolinase family protein [Mycolicibacterium hodleri]|uniref:Hydantoinase/oxoprolinase family protein n=1 Tax=Mycolicibacterium hodleri TaxID=49897 RepID=A0A502E7R4_9MYCO|nr:hydantoinase/oxoprolinase family protein [Mycolicibacterium hodleri]TPG32480.1 hydantoinase/oxoprolinase family protein [Mycolicibacterium hodleri]
MTDVASSSGSTTRIGADIGGTFTDVAAVGADGRLYIGKRLTTHGAEHEGVIQAVTDCGVDSTQPGTILAHGTTLVINALLERKGARVALVTTAGFADVLDIGRGNRSESLTLRFRRQPPLVGRDMCYEVAERTAPDGTIERTPGDDELDALVAWLQTNEADSVAIGFLHSYLAPGNEQHVADYLRRALPDVPVTISSDLSRQWREFERFTTATANAYVTPVTERYLHRLTSGLESGGFQGDFLVLDSSGGAMAVDTARRYPVRAVESGPVGGVIGARNLAVELAIDNVVSFDMGGTTAKSALVERGDFATKDTYWIGGEMRGFPLQVSTVDILEVGVGGGSIARVDDMGRLQVGPHSAGSQPGPACYGLGGTKPTLTDANLYCGRIDKDHFAETFELDVPAAERAIENLASQLDMAPERLALGIIRLATLQATATVRRQTLERGNDPRDYTLLASGGAGPLHACGIAVEAGIDRVLLPRFPGHYSALGMLAANLRTDRREVLLTDLATLDVSALATTVADVAKQLAGDLRSGDHPGAGAVVVRYSVAIRYRGQEHALWIPAPTEGVDVPGDLPAVLKKEFESEYVRRYGHLDTMSTLECVELEVVVQRLLPRVSMVYREPSSGEPTIGESIWDGAEMALKTSYLPRVALAVGDTINGPAVIHEVGATTAIPPGAVAEVQESGVIIIDVRGVQR